MATKRTDVYIKLLFALTTKLNVETFHSVRKLEEQENWWKLSKISWTGYLYEFTICNG